MLEYKRQEPAEATDQRFSKVYELPQFLLMCRLDLVGLA